MIYKGYEGSHFDYLGHSSIKTCRSTTQFVCDKELHGMMYFCTTNIIIHNVM